MLRIFSGGSENFLYVENCSACSAKFSEDPNTQKKLFRMTLYDHTKNTGMFHPELAQGRGPTDISAIALSRFRTAIAR